MRKWVLAGGMAFGLAGCGDDAAVAVPEDGPAVPVDTARPVAALRLEEICPGNVDLKDERGEDPGWVEIRNVTDSTVALGGWRLRGTAKDGAWRLPDSALPPGGRLLVFLSGLDRRRIVPAGDTVDLFVPKASFWSDSMNAPAGHSRWDPWEMANVNGTLEDGTPAVSAVLTKADNAGTGLEWSSVTATMRMPGNKVLDLSGRDRLVLVATIPQGQDLAVRLCEADAPCWNAPTVPLRGTGVARDRYDVSLLGLATNLARIQSLTIQPPDNLLGSYRFTLTGVRAYRSALWPHASFELSRKGAALTLEDTAGRATGTVVYPEMADAQSYVRDSATGAFQVRETPTPGTANPEGPAPALLAPPSFSVPSGFHPSPLRVEVGRGAGTTTRCAEGGALPTAASPAADSAVVLDSSAVLRCAAFAADGRRGPVATATYLLGEAASLPVVALTVDSAAFFGEDSGIYATGRSASAVLPYFGANFWRDKEIGAHVEFFEKGGSRAFSLPAGVSIYGNWSRANPKRSLSVQFREAYGARRVEWPLFPQRPQLRSFKGFGLRNGGNNCGKDYVRDALVASLADSRGLESMLSRHVLVFVNGRYWGIHDLREKMDPDYLETRLGVDPSQVELIKNMGEVQAGSVGGWKATIDAFLKGSFADSAGLARAAGMVDPDNYADYVATEVWASNTDWPANNTRMWRRAAPASPWRWMVFDVDFGVGSIGGSTDMLPILLDTSVAGDGYPNGQYSTVVFRRLAANPAWRERFVNRLCAHLATTFAPARVQATLDSMMAVLGPEVPRDQARWGYSAATMKNELRRMANFVLRRPAEVREDLRTTWGLGEDATVRLGASGGSLEVDGLPVGTEYAGTHFAGHALNLRAVAPAGTSFAGWSDGEPSASRRIVVPATGLELTATFR